MRFLRDRIMERHEAELHKARILKLLEGLFLGLSIGSFIGVLLAPKSGRDTLVDIKNTSTKFKDEVIEKGKSILPNKDDDEYFED